MDAIQNKFRINVSFTNFTNVIDRVRLDRNNLIEILYKLDYRKLLLSGLKSYGPACHFWGPKRWSSFPMSLCTIYQWHKKSYPELLQSPFLWRWSEVSIGLRLKFGKISVHALSSILIPFRLDELNCYCIRIYSVNDLDLTSISIERSINCNPPLRKSCP